MTTIGHRRAAALALCTSLTLGILAAPSAARPGDPSRPSVPAQEDDSAGLKAQFDGLSKKEIALLDQLDAVQRDRMKAADKLNTLKRQTQAKQVELLAATGELKAAERIADLRAVASRRAARKVTVTRERLRRQIVASYVTGGDTGAMEAFLNAQNGEEVGQALTYGHAVSGSTEALVGDFEDASRAAAKATRLARSAKARASAKQHEVSSATDFLVLAREEQSRLVTDLNVKVMTEAATLRTVQGEKAKLEGEINSTNRASDGVAQILNQLQADQPDWMPGSVEITTPIPGVKVSSPYGMRLHPILGIVRLHAGADLGAPVGTEIHAAADGVVVIAEVRGGYGNAVVIDHGNSLATLYGHTSKMLVKPGQLVKRGDVIALVGSTGLSTGPHLHFETRLKGLPINPEGVIDFNQKVVYPVPVTVPN